MNLINKKITNHPWCTAIKRTNISVPTKFLLKHNLVTGRILDYGCGLGYDTDELQKQGYDITGYDIHYRPEYPTDKFDTIICNYVLNVLESDKQAEVIEDIKNLLSPSGNAYIAVRRDIIKEGYRLHAIHRQYTYQCNVFLQYDSLICNKQYEIYKLKND